MRNTRFWARLSVVVVVLALAVVVAAPRLGADSPWKTSVDSSALDLDSPDVAAFYAKLPQANVAAPDGVNADVCQCVIYVKNRFRLTRTAAYAKDMGPALRAQGFRQVSSPQAGAVIIFQPSFGPGIDQTAGHVGVVESARSVGNNWAVTVRGSNQGGSWFTEYNCRNVSVVAFRQYPKSSTSVSYWVR